MAVTRFIGTTFGLRAPSRGLRTAFSSRRAVNGPSAAQRLDVALTFERLLPCGKNVTTYGVAAFFLCGSTFMGFARLENLLLYRWGCTWPDSACGDNQNDGGQGGEVFWHGSGLQQHGNRAEVPIPDAYPDNSSAWPATRQIARTAVTTTNATHRPKVSNFSARS